MPATKRFTVHRTSNVLTLSLKRFANFSGGKITKVNKAFLRYWLFWKSRSSVVSCFCLSVFFLFFLCFLRMLVTQKSWTSDPTCLRAQAMLLCTASMLFWCTLATVVMLATTTATSRWVLTGEEQCYFQGYPWEVFTIDLKCTLWIMNRKWMNSKLCTVDQCCPARNASPNLKGNLTYSQLALQMHCVYCFL